VEVLGLSPVASGSYCVVVGGGDGSGWCAVVCPGVVQCVLVGCGSGEMGSEVSPRSVGTWVGGARVRGRWV
jgi:hypothetical protein